MFFKYVEKSKNPAYIYSKKPLIKPVATSLLENLRCHGTDEYPVISSEDETSVPPLACNFSKGNNQKHILALVDESGSIVLYNTNLAGDDALLTDWIAHSNAVFDVEWMWTEQKLLTASGDQTVCLWDVQSRKKLLSFKGHTSSVRSVKYMPNNDAVFASGSRDGHVRLWDTRCNVKGEKVSCVNVIKNAHSVPLQAGGKRKKPRLGPTQTQDCQQSVTCVVFQNDNLLTTSGAVDGCIKVWDVRRIKADNNAAVYSFPYAGRSRRTHGFSSLTFDTYFTRLFANCTDDVIYCYDFISYNQEPVCTYKGHRNTSFYVKSVLSPDNEFLLSGSSDEHAYIWQVSKPNASPVILKGHRSEVSDVAWCETDLFRVVTTSDDNSMRVWRYDATAEVRKKMGRSDLSCGITGFAERRHRDIGTSVEPGPKTPRKSPQSALKRSATAPVGTVTELTPKQAKLSLTSTVSPSIKMWLKRSASDTDTKVESKAKSITQRTSQIVTGDVNETEKSAGSSDSLSNERSSNSCKTTCTSPSTAKRKKTESNDGCKPETERKSCKRKLVDENSPQKSKRKRIGSDSMSVNSNESSVIKAGQEGDKLCDIADISPCKDKTVLKDLQSEMNRSPIKDGADSDLKKSPCRNKPNVNLFSSPARVAKIDWNAPCYQSPTANLPNSVMDGPQTRMVDDTNEKDKIKTVDWLTQMRKQSLSRQSPKRKKGKGQENLSQSSSSDMTSSSQESDSSLMSSPKVKSPMRGVRAITHFFSPKSMKS